MQRCNHIQEKLTLYLEQELAEKEKNQVEEHLQHCVGCRQELTGLKTLSACLTQPSYEIPASYSSELIVSLNERLSRPKISLRKLAPSVSLVFAGLLALIAVVFMNENKETIFNQDYLLYQIYGGKNLYYDINSVDLSVSVMPENYFDISREYILENTESYQSENIGEVFADLDDETFKQIIKNIESTEL